MNGDLDVLVCLREWEGESTDSPTDINDSRIFLKGELWVDGQVSTSSHTDDITHESGLRGSP